MRFTENLDRQYAMTDYASLARRLQALAAEWPELTRTFSYMTGALYALRQADRIGVRDSRLHEETDRAEQMNVLRRVTEAIQAGIDPDMAWFGGFMYHSVITRIDMSYERSLEVIKAELEKQGHMASVLARKGISKTENFALQIEDALKLGQPLARVHLEENRRDVNRLKHHLFGREAVNQRSKTIGDLKIAAAALQELVTILERAEIRTCLAEGYKDLPPA